MAKEKVILSDEEQELVCTVALSALDEERHYDLMVKVEENWTKEEVDRLTKKLKKLIKK